MIQCFPSASETTKPMTTEPMTTEPMTTEPMTTEPTVDVQAGGGGHDARLVLGRDGVPAGVLLHGGLDDHTQVAAVVLVHAGKDEDTFS